MFLTVDSIQARDPRVLADAFQGIPGVVVWADNNVYSQYGAKCLVAFQDHRARGGQFGNFPVPERPMRAFRSIITPGAQGWMRPAPAGPKPDLSVDVHSVEGIEIYRDMSEVPRELRSDIWKMIDLWPPGGTGRWGSEACGLVWFWTDEGW